MTLYKWSQSAAANALADSTCPFPEGMSPAAVNDGTRGMMAAVAKHRDDTAGANNGTSGTSTAYTLGSNQVFDSAAHMAGQDLTIYPHATNGLNPTLNVDGLGSFPIVTDGSGTPVAPGTMVAGSPYEVAFQNSASRWLLKNFYAKPWEVPIGGMIDYFGSTVPNNNFVFPFGQAISRTTYAALFAMFGTTFGAGDGTATFNIPDLRGRVVAGKDDMGGVPSGRVGSVVTDTGTIVGATLGSAGGSPSHVLSTAEMPAHTHNNTLNDPGHNHSTNAGVATGGLQFGGNFGAASAGATNGASTTNVTISNASVGGGNAHAILQPTIVGNKLMRVI